MASIQWKKNIPYVVYYIDHPDKLDEKKQIWESCSNDKEALQRKAEVEYLLSKGITVAESGDTIRELWDLYLFNYALVRWSPSTLSSCKGLIRNYVLPYIGDTKLRDVRPLYIDTYYNKLRKTKAVSNGNRKQTGNVTEQTLFQIHRLLRAMFNKAVKWEKLTDNAFLKVEEPKYKAKKRLSWNDEQIIQALDHTKGDMRVHLAFHLAFACSMRPGEVSGCQWDRFDLSDEAIERDDAKLYLDRQLQRLYLEDIEAITRKDEVLLRFPPHATNPRTLLVLKSLKTESSERVVWIPRTLAILLRQWKTEQEEIKAFMGDAYTDYGLVIAHSDGRPVESQVICRNMHRIADELGFPQVVYHSLRTSSTTFKLLWSGGDIKAVQGDNGHAQAKMVTDTYSRILDTQRRKTAQVVEAQFYKQANTQSPKTSDAAHILEALKQDPELLGSLLSELGIHIVATA